MTTILNASSSSGLVATADTSAILQLQTGSTAALTIDASQNVGVGTASPDYKLVIDGEGANGGFALKRTGTLTGSGSLRLVGSSGSEALGFSVNATERMRLNVNGNIVLQGGTTTATGVGITFPATQSASSDANCLDDYEEGTWTPLVYIGSTQQTVGTASGSYTKIGNQVFFYFRCENITKSGTGSLNVQGFPFASISSGSLGLYPTIPVRFQSINPNGSIIGLFNPGASQMNFQNLSSTSGYTGATTNSDISATYQLYGVSGSYTVA